MKIYDVTVAVSETVPIYEGDPRVEIEGVKGIATGDSANVSKLCFGAHTGTHVDAPNHFIEGTRRVEDLELMKLVGPCRVIEVDDSVTAIGVEHVKGLAGVDRVAFKTRNSAFWNEPEKGFRTDFTYISPEAARALADAGVKLVGIDYLSVERFGSDDYATHTTLLEKEIVILEGLDLREVPAGDYEIVCLPLKYVGATGDGAPARTILRTL
ncbi:MAG TPA: cyclase family protein [Pyrinomonadaceae bacterium]|nr:cyclase family protein [Pyrinomonadaceae bacterium]